MADLALAITLNVCSWLPDRRHNVVFRGGAWHAVLFMKLMMIAKVTARSPFAAKALARQA